MPALDNFQDNPGSWSGLSNPAEHVEAVTPHNTNELTYVTRALWIGTGGDITVVTKNDETVQFTNVPDGTLLPVRVKQVKATGTDADDIVALS